MYRQCTSKKLTDIALKRSSFTVRDLLRYRFETNEKEFKDNAIRIYNLPQTATFTDYIISMKKAGKQEVENYFKIKFDIRCAQREKE